MAADRVASARAGGHGRLSRGDNRRFVHGVLWVLRSGMRGLDMPERYGEYKSVDKRFTRWAATGVWDRMFQRPSEGWREPLWDDRLRRGEGAPASRFGPKRGASETALGRSRGGVTAKIHLPANELGLPLASHFTGGQTHGCPKPSCCWAIGRQRPRSPTRAAIPTLC